MKLLIADDSSAIRSFIKNICKDMFNEIFECEDGRDAVEIYKKEFPDWVLMDIKMKEMDGITAAKLIYEEYPAAKIVIVSQYNDEGIYEASIKSGAVGFINKEDLSLIEKIIKK